MKRKFQREQTTKKFINCLTSKEVLSARCLNQHHFTDAELRVGHPVFDSYTMYAHQDGDEVHLFCPWCMYQTTHNVKEGNPVQVKLFSGKTFTFS